MMTRFPPTRFALTRAEADGARQPGLWPRYPARQIARSRVMGASPAGLPRQEPADG